MIPQGFTFAGVRCGLKNKRNDLGIILSDRPAKAAALFTTNHVRAACVEFSKRVVERGTLRAIVVNSGNANCCTGLQGERDAARMAELTACELGLDAHDVAVAQTGVIGQLIDMAKVERGIKDAATKLSEDPKPFMDAILTTDLVEKQAFARIAPSPRRIALGERVAGEALARPSGEAEASAAISTHLTPTSKTNHFEQGGPCVYGVAKGSGMIAPNMATMLGFVVTDADTSGFDLDQILRHVCDKSFNCMTVDGDTSTNDMILLMANGASGVKPDEAAFEAALQEVCVSLAKQIARDGEGATKLVEVVVTGTADPKKIARTIAESPLVKTAMFGCDPNWGRILMAAGRAGVPFDPNRSTLVVMAGDEEFTLFEDGGPAAFDAKRVSAALKSDYVKIDLTLGEGESATIYTCDFGYGYVRINAEYHT